MRKTGLLPMQKQSNCTADQRLCFRCMDSTIPPLPKSKFQDCNFLLRLYMPVCVGPGRKPRRQVFLNLVRNPDDWFARVAAHMFSIMLTFVMSPGFIDKSLTSSCYYGDVSFGLGSGSRDNMRGNSCSL